MLNVNLKLQNFIIEQFNNSSYYIFFLSIHYNTLVFFVFYSINLCYIMPNNKKYVNVSFEFEFNAAFYAVIIQILYIFKGQIMEWMPMFLPQSSFMSFKLNFVVKMSVMIFQGKIFFTNRKKKWQKSTLKISKHKIKA